MREVTDVLWALRAGDEAAFATLVDDLSPRLLKVARTYVKTTAAAEDAVQETWLAVVKGLDGFEGRSALTTWIFGICINVARRRGVRDARTVPFASVGDERFLPDDHPQWPGHWSAGPEPWPEQALETAEALAVLHAAVDALPDAQRDVIVLRDMVGCTAEETRDALGLTDTNQRVLLHRARTRVRAALEAFFA